MRNLLAWTSRVWPPRMARLEGGSGSLAGSRADRSSPRREGEMKSTLFNVLGIVAACSVTVTVAAQWPKYQETNVPRDAQGRPRMDAPAPRTADGKPDLSGNWVRADRDPIPSEIAGLVGPRAGQTGRGGAP